MFIKSDTYIKKVLFCIMVFVDIVIMTVGIRSNNICRSLIIITVIMAIYLFIIMLYMREGLYIDHDTLCYKGVRKRFYNINDIARIHIVTTQICLGYNLFDSSYNNISVKDLKGNYHYKILYLNNKNIKMCNNDYGDLDFYFNHKDNVLFWTEYDERVIEFFKSRGVLITGQKQ